MNTATYRMPAAIINAVIGIIALFLILDVVLKFFSANSLTPVVAWIYFVSDFLTAPFAGIVPDINVSTGILDIVALVSLIFYAAAGYLILGLIQSFLRPTISDEEYPEDEYEEGKYPGTVHYHNVPRGRKLRSQPKQ